MTDIKYITETKKLIDDLKSVCANYGLGNDGNEFKIISQVFLYKYMNDKFSYEVKQMNPKLASAENFQKAYEEIPEVKRQFLLARLGNKAPHLKPEQLLSHLFNNSNQPNFSEIYFDGTLRNISQENINLYSIKSTSGAKDTMFDELSKYITDPSQRDNFCKALVNKLVNFSFEKMFSEKYDFFATIFEYLIKDYNSDSGGKYAEYYTPHAVARIMASILVGKDEDIKDVKIYDPSAGSGTLLMNIAHAIGEKNCTIYSEDISQKSSNMLRLNLILNNLSHSIPNIVKGNTILEPSYVNQKFDYIVSNPPFKLDFSDYRDNLDKDSNRERFFAGIPNIPKKDKDKMSIYLLFIQHIMYSLSEKGKAAIVVPTGFITAQIGSIEKKIRQKLIDSGWLRGVVSMPSNIFARTGTNVSVLFLDKNADNKHIVLMDASKLGDKIKENDKFQRTILEKEDEQQIIDIFNEKKAVEDLSVVVTAEEIKAKNYSFSAGQYFDIKIEYVEISAEKFAEKMNHFETTLKNLFEQSNQLDKEILENFKKLKFK